ncbi:hypothetical protein [Methylobacterium sp. J-092]|uniref:hypothetical protein n=1 Tax=Methylobacterium sp. J-092 TaxID=2836667 RepID=UPI001FB9EFC5|nr:hypothetical protein [Methylobacterium sp. J-092]MCJ2009369.1 hypothetical protein [Methylobacterium sp. J-092]
MRRQLIALAAVLLPAQIADAHALFPGQQVVLTAGERGIAYFQAVNDRKDVSEYVVELFDFGTWMPTRYAVASPDRVTVPSAANAFTGVAPRRITVMVDLDGKPERIVRVCTKSVARRDPFRAASTSVNTRVCSKLIVRRLQ